jgi:hypothetical protein
MVKKTLVVILVVFLFSAKAYGTMQRNEVFIYEGIYGELYVDLVPDSPLSKYFGGYNVFPMLSTANYRGYIATWEIKDGILYLNKVVIPESDVTVEVPLNLLFPNHVAGEPIAATWFTGVILTCVDPIDPFLTTGSGDPLFKDDLRNTGRLCSKRVCIYRQRNYIK